MGQSPTCAVEAELQAQFWQSISQMCSVAPEDREASKQCSRLLGGLMLTHAPPATLSSAVNIAKLNDWESTTKRIAIDLADIILCRSRGSSGYDWGYNTGSLGDVIEHHFQYFVSHLKAMRANLWLKLAQAVLSSFINKPNGIVQFIREFPSVIETVMYAYVDTFNFLTHLQQSTPRLDRPMLNKLTTFLLIGSMVKDGPPSINLVNMDNLYKKLAANNFAKFHEPFPLSPAIFSEALTTMQYEYSRFAMYLRAVAEEGSGPQTVLQRVVSAISSTTEKRSLSKKLLGKKPIVAQKISPIPANVMRSPRKRPHAPPPPPYVTVQSEEPQWPAFITGLGPGMMPTQHPMSPTSLFSPESSSGTVRRRTAFKAREPGGRRMAVQAQSEQRVSQGTTPIPQLSILRMNSRASKPTAPKSEVRRWKY